MYKYVVKYAVIVEDENGEFVELACGDYFDTNEEALEFIKAVEEDEE